MLMMFFLFRGAERKLVISAFFRMREVGRNARAIKVQCVDFHRQKKDCSSAIKNELCHRFNSLFIISFFITFPRYLITARLVFSRDKTRRTVYCRLIFV